jgi:hypothetical protein
MKVRGANGRWVFHSTIIKECLICGKEMRLYPSHAARLYCSRQCARLAQNIPIDVSFWKYTKKGGEDECWPWIASLNGYGYGQCQGSLAHRVSYELHFGPIASGLSVLHKCDNRACVNPSRLFLGTQAQNMADMTIKDRSLYGERNHQAKLTEAQVLQIRGLLELGHSLLEIAAHFRVSRDCIYNIRRGKSWRRLQISL